MNTIKEKLIEKIQAGEVSMVPKWQFVLQTVLFAVGTVIVAVVAIYLLSFVLFALHRTGILFAPLYGWHGFMLFIVSSPWFLISLVGVFLVVLYLLVTHFSFSYKRPLVYSMVGTALLVVMTASLIHQTTMHERLEQFVDHHNVPGLAPMYRGIGEETRPDGMITGVILAISDESITLQTKRGEEIFILLTSKTKLPRRGTLEVGQEVFVFGNKNDDEIEAFGVRPANGRFQGQKSGQLRPPFIQR